MKAVVLAAGKGERLWPLTENVPKHLLPIGNKPILARTLEGVAESGIQEVLLVVQFKSEKIKERLGSGRHIGCRIRYIEQKELGGTANALDSCRDELRKEDQFLVLYGDDYYGEDAIKNFLSRARKNEGITLGTAEAEAVSRFGSLEVRRDRVTGIREKVSDKQRGRVNAGLYLMDQSIFPAIGKTERSRRGEFELTDSIQILIDAGEQIHAAPLRRGDWSGISYPWDLLEANQLAVSSEKTELKGRIEQGARIKGIAITEPGSLLKSGTYVEGPVHIGRNTVIGPNAYLRPYSSIGNDVKIGASSEVKNSIISDGAKVPHLSYVGDSIIGERASLGAGTITANLRFDEAEVRSRVKGELVETGRKKFGAVIGDDVRTGINVSLFPGVKLGGGVWVGPGAIVETDVVSGTRLKGRSEFQTRPYMSGVMPTENGTHSL